MGGELLRCPDRDRAGRERHRRRRRQSDRLLPDLLAGLQDGVAPLIRYPDAVRPWQHVLDAVNGYTVLADALCSPVQ